MIAAPIIPGRLYRVFHGARRIVIIAPDPCTAIRIACDIWQEHAA